MFFTICFVFKAKLWSLNLLLLFYFFIINIMYFLPQEICDDSHSYKNLVGSLHTQAQDISPELTSEDNQSLDEQLQRLDDKFEK